MEINISARHTELTEGLKTHVQQKAQKISQHNKDAIHLDVVLIVEGKTHTAETKLHAAGKDYFATASTHEDMYHAIDEALAKLLSQVDKIHDKRVK